MSAQDLPAGSRFGTLEKWVVNPAIRTPRRARGMLRRRVAGGLRAHLASLPARHLARDRLRAVVRGDAAGQQDGRAAVADLVPAVPTGRPARPGRARDG